MRDVVKTPQLTAPTAIAELPRGVCRSTIHRRIDHDLLNSRLNIGCSALHETKAAEREAECLESLLTWRTTRPEPEFHWIGPPPRSVVLRCPGDTVIARSWRTRDGIPRSSQTREELLDLVVAQINPSSLPQASHASAIRSIRPRSSGWTGSTPVIALRAQNQCSGSVSSSMSKRGTTCGPSPMIC